MERQHQEDVQPAVHFVFNSKNRHKSIKVDRRKKKKIQAFAEQTAGTMRDTLRARCFYSGCLFPGCCVFRR